MRIKLKNILSFIAGFLLGSIFFSSIAYAASVIQINAGGTSTSTAPGYGQVLVGNNFGKYDLVATSSLGISSTGASSTLLTDFNNFSNLQTFLGGFMSTASSSFKNATSTALYTSVFGLGAEYFSGLLGTGLINTGGNLTVTLSPFSTTNLAEGSNLYWTNDRFDTRLAATTSLPNLTTLANLSTVGTITTGVWQGTPIGDAYITKTGDWTGTFDGQEGSYYLNRANHTGTQAASTITGGTFGAGDFVFPSALTVTGLSTLTGGFISNASSSMSAGLQVAGALNASGTLNVAGSSVFNNANISLLPTNPTYNAGYDNNAKNANAVSVQGKYAVYGKSADTGTCSSSDATGCEVGIFDATSSTLNYLNGIDVGTTVNAVLLTNSFLYVGINANTGFCSSTTSNGCEVQIYDISNPALPIYVGGIDSATTVNGLALLGGNLLIAKSFSATACAATTPSGCELQMYNVTNPAIPAFVSGGNDSGAGNYTALTVSGPRVYVVKSANAGTCSTTDNTGCELQVFKIFATSTLRYVNGISNGDNNANSVTSWQDMVFVGNSANAGTCSPIDNTGCELQLYNFDNLLSPYYLSGYDTTENVNTVINAGRYLYLGKSFNSGTCSATDSTGCELQVFDIATSTATYIGGANSGGPSVNEVKVSGTSVYASVGGSVTVCTPSSSTGCEYQIYALKRLEVPALSANSFETALLSVLDDAYLNNNAFIRGGLFVGNGGISSVGPSTFFSTTTFLGNVSLAGPTTSIFSANPTSNNDPSTLYMFSGNSSFEKRILSFSPDEPNLALTYDGAADTFNFRNVAADILSINLSSSRVGIGTATPSTPLEVLSTSAVQSRISYDGSNYFDTSVDSVGLTSFNSTGSGAGFSFLQSGRFGTAGSPTRPLEVFSTLGNQFKVAYNASNYALFDVGSNGATQFDALGTGASFNLIDETLVGSSGTAQDPLEVRNTTGPQFRNAYNTSQYMTINTASNGATTIDNVGTSPSLTFNDPLTAVTGFTSRASSTALTLQIPGALNASSSIFIKNSLFLGQDTTNRSGLFNIDSSGNISASGTIGVAGGSAGKATCWKADGKTIGYCSSAVDAFGACTCN